MALRKVRGRDQVLTDLIWEQLQVTMKERGCHRWKNDRFFLIEAILWKLWTMDRSTMEKIFLKRCVSGKQHATDLIVGRKKDCGGVDTGGVYSPPTGKLYWRSPAPGAWIEEGQLLVKSRGV